VSLHYLVKYKFSKITVITINTYAKTYPMKQLFTNFLISVKFFSFRCTSSVCKHAVQDGPEIKLQTLVNIFTKYWWILPILSVLWAANNFQWRVMTNLTTPKTCGYITLKNNCFQKLCPRSTVTSDPTCAYWRECKHNLKLKCKLIFWPILYDSIVLLCLQTPEVYLKLKVI